MTLLYSRSALTLPGGSPTLALLCGVLCNNIDRETQQYLTTQIYIHGGLCTPVVLALTSWGSLHTCCVGCTVIGVSAHLLCLINNHGGVCTPVVLALQSWGVCTPLVLALQSWGCLHTCCVGFTVMGVSAYLLCWIYSHWGVCTPVVLALQSCGCLHTCCVGFTGIGVSAHLLCWL